MVDALLKDYHYDQPGLFVDKGNEQELLGIRAAVNTGAEFPPHCANSMAEASLHSVVQQLFREGFHNTAYFYCGLLPMTSRANRWTMKRPKASASVGC